MAKPVTTRADTKGVNKQRSEATQAGAPEQKGKLPAEKGTGERTQDRPVFLPWVDIYETETALVVAADLPGVNPESLEVNLERRVLSIYGRVDEDAPPGYSRVYREYEVGDFERQFTLSGDFDIDRIEADLTDGVLRLTIPRAPERAAKRIDVRSA
jgi:HSP20 family molecular chaperone IbpA